VMPMPAPDEAPNSDDQLLPLKDVLKDIGVGSTTLYRWIAAGTFPQPRKLASGIIRFRSKEVREWKENLPMASIRGSHARAA
jgi:prophage regulatory protein